MRYLRSLTALAAALSLAGCGDWTALLPGTPAGEKNFWILISGFNYTILISVYAIIFGSIIGLVGALLARSPSAWLRRAVWLYVELFRMVPLFVLLLWIYYALPILILELPDSIARFPGVEMLVKMDPLTAGVIGLSLLSGAFMVEIFRAGIESVGKAQVDAGLAFGMSRIMVMRRIILPQAIRRMLPPMTNQFISTIKDSSVAGFLGAYELTKRAMLMQTQILHPLEIYTFLAIEYILFLTMLTALARYLERRYPQHG